MTDPTSRAKKLLTRFRTLKPDDVAELPPADIALLDRGLCSLIDRYDSGKPMRIFWRRVKAAESSLPCSTALCTLRPTI